MWGIQPTFTYLKSQSIYFNLCKHFCYFKYNTEREVMSVSAEQNFIEIYHFINPLGRQCFISEKEISEFSKERYEKVSIRFIPFFNFSILNLQLSREDNQHATLNDRNNMYSNAYLASLGFYAASIQGKKWGRKYLMVLQEGLFANEQQVTIELLNKIAEDINIDLEMFQEDIESDCVKQMFVNDQKFAHEIDVSKTPTCIVYANGDDDTAYLIEEFINKEMLHSICKNDYVLESHTSNIVPLDVGDIYY